MPKYARHLTTVAALLALVACNDKSSPPAASPRAPVITLTHSTELPKPVTAAPVPDAPLPDVGEEDDDVPLGPMFPPARVNPPTAAEAQTFGDQISYWQKWFKDAFPAGESRAVRFHSAADTDLSHQIRRNQAPEALVPALALNTAFPNPISQILDRRNNNDTTKFLRLYLTANNPRVAASAAEVVIENIFYGDRSAQAKCVEIGNDFEAIMQYGYFDASVAGRREYLQARLDQVYSRAQQPKDGVNAVVVYVGVPLALSSVFGATGRALEHVSERVAALRGSGGVKGAVEGAISRGGATRFARSVNVGVESLLDRARARSAARSEVIVGKFLRQKGLPIPLALQGETKHSLERGLTINGVAHEFTWHNTNEPMLRFFRTRQHDGVEIAKGAEMMVFEFKDGRRVHYATTGYFAPRALDDVEQALGRIPPSTLQAVDAAGRLHATDVSVAELSGLPFRGPRAYRPDAQGSGGARIVEESGVITDAAASATSTPHAAVTPTIATEASEAGATTAAPAEAAAAATTRKSFDKKHALVGAAAGLGAIIGVRMIDEVSIREDEMNINALYLGGEIGNSARPGPALKTGRVE